MDDANLNRHRKQVWKGWIGLTLAVALILLIVLGFFWTPWREAGQPAILTDLPPSQTQPEIVATEGEAITDVMMILGAPVQEDLDRRPVVLEGVQANEVLSERTILAGPSDEQQVPILMPASAADSSDIESGQTLSISGVIRTVDSDSEFSPELGLTETEIRVFRRAGLYVNATEVRTN